MAQKLMVSDVDGPNSSRRALTRPDQPARQRAPGGLSVANPSLLWSDVQKRSAHGVLAAVEKLKAEEVQAAGT